MISYIARLCILLGAVMASVSLQAREKNGDLLNCSQVGEVLDFSNYRGQTYLSFMETVVKPVMDGYATEGYTIASSDRILQAFKKVSSGVQWKVLKTIPGKKQPELKKLQRLEGLIDQLQGQTTTLYELPQKIREADSSFTRPYKLSTFIGLASCAGPVIRYHDDNYAYNIHYGTGAVEKDDRTGRSFGAGPSRKAEDASDKNYLIDLEEYMVEHSENTSEFYQTLLQTLLDSNADNYPKIEAAGQTLLTDFLAVYTAEQARNLMDGKIYPHWDASLLEVTLLGAFHAGQETIKLLYQSPFDRQDYFVSKNFKQTTGCDLNAMKTGESSKEPKVKKAGLVDVFLRSFLNVFLQFVKSIPFRLLPYLVFIACIVLTKGGLEQ